MNFFRTTDTTDTTDTTIWKPGFSIFVYERSSLYLFRSFSPHFESVTLQYRRDIYILQNTFSYLKRLESGIMQQECAYFYFRIGIKDGAYYCLCAHYLSITQCIDHAIHTPSREYCIFGTLLVACCFKSWICWFL